MMRELSSNDLPLQFAKNMNLAGMLYYVSTVLAKYICGQSLAFLSDLGATLLELTVWLIF